MSAQEILSFDWLGHPIDPEGHRIIFSARVPLLAAAVALAACSTTPVTATVAAGTSFDCASMAAAFTTNGSANAELPEPIAEASCEGDTVTVTANGIPDFTYVETSPGAPTAQDLTFALPGTPVVADE
ncbi:MAG: hypothetical protein ACI867_001997, partial [Glaciecola sp.]